MSSKQSESHDNSFVQCYLLYSKYYRRTTNSRWTKNIKNANGKSYVLDSVFHLAQLTTAQSNLQVHRTSIIAQRANDDHIDSTTYGNLKLNYTSSRLLNTQLTNPIYKGSVISVDDKK